MVDNSLDITPSVTVHKLLQAYPDLEDVLISLAPAFRKLKNPLLRRSVAKIATLRQASAVGAIPLEDLIDTLREAAGQAARTESYAVEDYFTEQPKWFSFDQIALTINEAQANPSEMTLGPILRGARNLKEGQIIELVTTFLPAPGIDVMKSKHYSVWVSKAENQLIKTYFLKNKP